jgi:hypothetical protein
MAAETYQGDTDLSADASLSVGVILSQMQHEVIAAEPRLARAYSDDCHCRRATRETQFFEPDLTLEEGMVYGIGDACGRCAEEVDFGIEDISCGDHQHPIDGFTEAIRLTPNIALVYCTGRKSLISLDLHNR